MLGLAPYQFFFPALTHHIDSVVRRNTRALLCFIMWHTVFGFQAVIRELGYDLCSLVA